MAKELNTSEVLRYFKPEESMPDKKTRKRHYLKHRKENGVPYRCDINDCPLHQDATWRDSKLVLIMDHINGEDRDNRPPGLRLVCPNCASQLYTHAGGNADRQLDIDDSGYSRKGILGNIVHEIIPEGGATSSGSHDVSDD